MVEDLLLNPEVYNHVYDNPVLVPLLCQNPPSTFLLR